MLEKVLYELIYVMVIITVPILAKCITAYLSARKDQIISNKESIVFSKTLEETISLIQTVVDMVSQTYVDDLKKEGKFTKECQKEALTKAIMEVRNLLSVESVDILESVYNDLDAWIETQIESYINRSKIA